MGFNSGFKVLTTRTVPRLSSEFGCEVCFTKIIGKVMFGAVAPLSHISAWSGSHFTMLTLFVPSACTDFASVYPVCLNGCSGESFAFLLLVKGHRSGSDQEGCYRCRTFGCFPPSCHDIRLLHHCLILSNLLQTFSPLDAI